MKGALVYLDVCALSRPFDDQSFLRIRLGVRLILRSKLGKMAVNEECPEMLPAIA